MSDDDRTPERELLASADARGDTLLRRMALYLWEHRTRLDEHKGALDGLGRRVAEHEVLMARVATLEAAMPAPGGCLLTMHPHIGACLPRDPEPPKAQECTEEQPHSHGPAPCKPCVEHGVRIGIRQAAIVMCDDCRANHPTVTKGVTVYHEIERGRSMVVCRFSYGHRALDPDGSILGRQQ